MLVPQVSWRSTNFAISQGARTSPSRARARIRKEPEINTNSAVALMFRIIRLPVTVTPLGNENARH